MPPIEVVRSLDSPDLDSVKRLVSTQAKVRDRDAVTAHGWLNVQRVGSGGAVGLVYRGPGGDPAAYAQLAPERDRVWSLGLAVSALSGASRSEVGRALIGEAADVVRGIGGGTLQVWVSDPNADDDKLALTSGLRRSRDLLQMRRSISAEEPARLAIRPFVVGEDDLAWLEVNNRAFADHPEQGDWDEAALRQRESEPWFDPQGFLLHERHGRLAGFCWTKVHSSLRPPLGELYVLGVDPDFQGLGLGRELALAGLHYLAGRGLGEVMLYVDASNHRAVSLYRDLGFTVRHLDRAYVTEVPPSPTKEPRT